MPIHENAEPATFGAMLAAEMKAKKLDYRTLAVLVGVSHAYLWQLATAERRAINDPRRRPKRASRELVVKLARAMECDPDALLKAAGYCLAATENGQDVPVAGIARYTRLEPDAPALFQRGLEETRRGQPEKGLALLKHAVGHEGVSFVRAHVGLGVAYFATRQYEEAIAEFDKALARYPEPHHPAQRQDGVELADVYYNRGLAFQDSGRPGRAVADMRRAISLGGTNRDQHYAGLCFNEVGLGRFRRAIRGALEFLEASEQAPFSTAALDVRLYHAYAQARRGNFEAAFGLAEATRLLCPTYWYSHYVLAVVCSRHAESLGDRPGGARGLRARDLERLVALGLKACEKAVGLNPASTASFRADREDDLRYFRRRPEFARFFEPAERPE